MRHPGWLLVALILTAFGLASCSSSEVPDQLERAVQCAEQMTSEPWLEGSAFFAIFPDGTPRQYVSFLFSSVGAAERPPMEKSGEFDSEEEASMRSIGHPVWPAGVSMTHSKPDPALGMQVVWKWDDARRVIILEGYADPTLSPIVVRETSFPSKVRVSDLARVAAQSLLEQGARPQGF